MTSVDGTFSPKSFLETAESFGYNYSDMGIRSSVGDSDTPLFKGRVGLWTLPCGVSLCSSDLQVLHDSEHEGELERSLTIAMILGGGAAEVEFGDSGCLSMETNSSAVVSVSDAERLASRNTAGQSGKTLLVRVRPEDFADDEVAQKIELALRETSAMTTRMSYRTRLLADELAAPNALGAVGRLFAESCALEILGRALLEVDETDTLATASLTARDYAKVLRIRDMLIATPSASFTLSGLAREAGMSVTALKTKFSLAFGQPVFAFLRDVRMNRARDGIELEGWSVSEAAYFVGYRQQSNFSAAFRRKFGIAPSQLKPR